MNTITPTSIIYLDNIKILIKREDQNITGSQKDRYIGHAIPRYSAKGYNQFVISSTGNASIAATRYCLDQDLKLTIFLSPKTVDTKIDRLIKILYSYYNKSKYSTEENEQLEILNKKNLTIGKNSSVSRSNDREIVKSISTKGIEYKGSNISSPKQILVEMVKILKEDINVIFTDRPISDSVKFSKPNNQILLRRSQDIYGTGGYEAIAYELAESAFKVEYEIKNIFIPTSSGCTALGIYNGFLKLSKKSSLISIPKFHIVQTTSVNTIARNYDKSYTDSKDSIAKAITDRISHRYKEVVEMITKTNGTGWVISDSEILSAKRLLRSKSIEASNESALSLAALNKAIKEGLDISGSVLIFTGKA